MNRGFHENSMEILQSIHTSENACYNIKSSDYHFAKIQIQNYIENSEKLFTKCVIKITDNSTGLSSLFTHNKNCVFDIVDSNVHFNDCCFFNAVNILFLIRENSKVTFNKCIFDNNFVSCKILDHSRVEFIDCKFKDDKFNSICVSNDSQANIEDCIFINNNGKILHSKSSRIYVINTKFENCKKLIADASNSSSLIFKNVTIQHISNGAICVRHNSNIEASNIKIDDINGNSFIIYDSRGNIDNSYISNSSSHPISIYGKISNPIFTNSHFESVLSKYCIVCKNRCWPSFYNCTFSKLKYNCFSVSTFSMPHIECCSFTYIFQSCIIISKGCKVTCHKTDFGGKIVASSETFKLLSLPRPQNEREENFWKFLHGNTDKSMIPASVKSLLSSMRNDKGENDKGENEKDENDKGENEKGENDKGENEKGEGENDDEDCEKEKVERSVNPSSDGMLCTLSSESRLELHLRLVQSIVAPSRSSVEKQSLLATMNRLSTNELRIQVRNLQPLFADRHFLKWLTSLSSDSDLFEPMREALIEVISESYSAYAKKSPIKQSVYETVERLIGAFEHANYVDESVFEFITSEPPFSIDDEGSVFAKMIDHINSFKDNGAEFILPVEYFEKQLDIFLNEYRKYMQHEDYDLQRLGKSMLTLFFAAQKNQDMPFEVMATVRRELSEQEEFMHEDYEDFAYAVLSSVFSMDT